MIYSPVAIRKAQELAQELKLNSEFVCTDVYSFQRSGSAPYDIVFTSYGADAIARLATWAHPMSSVINALLNVGIQIERVSEFPFSPYSCFEGMAEREPGRFYLTHQGNDVPIVYSITGRKVA